MSQKIYDIILHLGSNIGHRNANLWLARHRISNLLGPALSASHLYETSAWGLEAQRSFLNVAVRHRAAVTPEQLLAFTQGIEVAMGRRKQAHWGSRNIDIDILYVGDHVCETPTLTLPHPLLVQRRFVLIPLLDIAPDWRHPILGQDTATLLQSCTDTGQVVRCA